MSDRGRGRARGRAGRGGDGSGQQPRRPGQQGHPQQQGPQQPGPQQPGPQQQGPPRAPQPGPRPQPPSAWGPPSVAPPIRAGMPTQSVGRASHRSTPSTHDHPGDVDIQQRMQAMALGNYKYFIYNLPTIIAGSNTTCSLNRHYSCLLCSGDLNL